MEPTYKITRIFENCEYQLLQIGISLEEAKAHCSDPETSSRTCSTTEGIALTAARGKWFDVFTEE